MSRGRMCQGQGKTKQQMTKQLCVDSNLLWGQIRRLEAGVAAVVPCLGVSLHGEGSGSSSRLDQQSKWQPSQLTSTCAANQQLHTQVV